MVSEEDDDENKKQAAYARTIRLPGFLDQWHLLDFKLALPGPHVLVIFDLPKRTSTVADVVPSVGPLVMVDGVVLAT